MPGITGADCLGRYHSVTRQLLRKADGVVLMYDITSQESFVHVRYWLDCLRVSCWLQCAVKRELVSFPLLFLSQDYKGHNVVPSPDTWTFRAVCSVAQDHLTICGGAGVRQGSRVSRLLGKAGPMS